VANLHFQLSWNNEITLLPPPTQHHSFFRNFHPLFFWALGLARSLSAYCIHDLVNAKLGSPYSRSCDRLGMKLCCRPLAKNGHLLNENLCREPILWLQPCLLLAFLGQNRIPYTKFIKRWLRNIIFLLLSQVWSRVYTAASGEQRGLLHRTAADYQAYYWINSHILNLAWLWYSPPNFPIIFAWNDRSGSICLILRLLQCPLPIQQQQHTPTVNSDTNISNETHETFEPLMACMPCETAHNVQTSHFK